MTGWAQKIEFSYYGHLVFADGVGIGEILERLLGWIVVSVLVLLVALKWALDFHEYVGIHFLDFVTFGRWPKENESFLAGLLINNWSIWRSALFFGFGLALLVVMYKYLDAGWRFLFGE